MLMSFINISYLLCLHDKVKAHRVNTAFITVIIIIIIACMKSNTLYATYYPLSTYYYYYPLSTYNYFPLHLTITPSFHLIYLSVYYFLQDDYTPLHIACLEGHESTVLVLLQNKADPNLQTEVTSRTLMMMIVDGDDDDNYDGDR